MLRYAFDRKIPLQMVLSAGYDEVLNESTYKASFDEVTVVYRFYECIDPNQYNNYEEYVENVCKVYEERFNELARSRKAETPGPKKPNMMKKVKHWFSG